MGRRRVEISQRENNDLAALRTLHGKLSDAVEHDVRKDILKPKEREFLQRLTDLVEQRGDEMSERMFSTWR